MKSHTIAIIGLVLLCSSCGGGAGGSGGGSGCENGIQGDYNITYSDCPSCYAYPSDHGATEFSITQSGDNLQFLRPSGNLIFLGQVDANCVVNIASSWNDAQYYCEGTWTNGELELICDKLENCSQSDSYVSGSCTERSTR